MKRKLCLTILFVFLIQCSAYTYLPPASAQLKLPVRNLDTGLDYATIQEAITATETLNGHTIQVQAGAYYENLIINKSISLIGQKNLNTAIIGQAPTNVIQITVDNVKITEFTIKESAYGYSSIYIHNAKEANITSNIIENNYYGINLHNSSHNSITGNLISYCEYGIRLYNSTSNNLSENYITNNKNGIHLDLSSENTITKDTVSHNLWNGIYLFHSTDNTITNNVLNSNTARGIRLHNSQNNTLSQNTISKSQSGLHLFLSLENNIYSNTISDNTDGIWLMDSNQNTIRANKIATNSRYGLHLLNSSHNTMFHNNFINNTLGNVEQPTNTSIANLWDNFFEGNYWSDQPRQDINKDGINDTPYIIDQRAWLGIHRQDNHPLMGQFQNLNLQFQNQAYSIEVISNSTITDIQYKPDEAKLILKTDNLQNTSFCRISIPHTLISPPYSIAVNNKPPVHASTINTNGTHTWIYFEYTESEPTASITLTPVPPQPIWVQMRFWEILGLATLALILSMINVKHYRTINKQKRLLRLYEQKLQKANPLVIAQELFTADVANRKSKIAQFETKYGLKIQPGNSFEGILKSIKSKQKESKKPEE